MKNIKYFFNQLRKIFYESDKYKIYYYNRKNGPEHYFDPEIKVYSEFFDIPNSIKSQLFNYPRLNSFYYRIKSHQAILLVLSDGDKLISYGWIQKWKPFKRKFGWIFENAVMLGPYWTDSVHRGKGIYGRMLKHSISLVPKESPVIIYTSPENISSQKGIEKMDFQLIGSYEVNLYLRYFCSYSKIS